jgi:spore germination protein YaaH
MILVNKNITIAILTIIYLGFLITIPYFVFAKTPERIFYTNKIKEKEAILSIKKNYKKIDILAPQSYALTTKLKLAGGLSANLKKVIKNYKFQTMPLVTNGVFEQNIIHNLLINEPAQNDFISDLIKTAKKEKYIGWQYDFENISYLDKDLFSLLIERTAKEFKKNNLIFSVAVVTRQTDFEDTDAFKNWSGVFDYKRIADSVDFISLMTYDDPYSQGPVASIPFIENCLKYVKDKIPNDKLSLGIPLYYWSWQINPFKKINFAGNYKRLLDIMASNRHSIGFDQILGNSWMTYSYYNKQYVFWFTDKKTIQLRMDIIKNYNLRGFSAWVLGVEDPAIWQAI